MFNELKKYEINKEIVKYVKGGGLDSETEVVEFQDGDDIILKVVEFQDGDDLFV